MYENKILDAIQTLVDNAIGKAEFDKTIKGVVSSCVDEMTGKYIIKYQDSSFYAYSTDTSQKYSKGTYVYVLIPGNDKRSIKTIIGSVNKLGSDYVNIIDEINQYDIIGNSVVSLDNEQGICSYHENGQALVLYNKIDSGNALIDIDETGLTTYVKQAKYLVLGGTFRTDLVKEQRYKGNYGLGFDLNFLDNMTGETVKRTYLVNVNNMSGNPYEYTKPSEQKIIFNIDGANFIDIDKIYLYGYDFPNETSESKPNDIFVSNVVMAGADALDSTDLTGNKLTLLMPQGIYFDNNDLSTAIRKINTEIRIENKLVENTSSLLKFYWFKENYTILASDLKYQRYGGLGWECLNNFNEVKTDENEQATLVDWITTQSSLSISKQDVAAARTTDYKCVVVYNNTIVLSKKFTIYNYSSTHAVTITSDGGVNFSYDNGKPTLTCSVTPNGTYSYYWGMIDSGGNYSSIEETTSRNTPYHTKLNRYNELSTGLKNGTIPLTSDYQTELNQLEYDLKQYENIMRVDGNQIVNLKLNMISNFATFVCYVKSGNTYLGKGSIKITNNLNTTDNSYSLTINNDNQVFKYSGDGISPASQYLENPQEIYPLSFILYDEKGNPIDDNAINAGNILWTVPTTNTMIKVSPIHGNPTFVDDINETATYTQYRQFFFEIPTIYNNNKIRNTIQLEVRYKDKVIRGKAELVFLKEGESGSNGTDFICRIIPNVTNLSTAPLYPTVTYDNNAAEGTANPILNYTPAQTGVWFKAQLFKDGEEIFNGPISATSSEGKAVTVQWEMLKNNYGTYNYTSISDVSNFSVNANTGVFSYNTLSSVSDDTLKNSPSNIVKCTLTYDGSTYIATMPIILTKVNNSVDGSYKVFLNENTGFRYAIYSNDGRNPAYSSSVPFRLQVLETIEGSEQDVSIMQDETKVNYTPSVYGAIWNGSSWDDVENLVEKEHSIANPLAWNEIDYKPIDIYNGLAVNNGIKVVITRSGDKLAEILIPVHLYLNRYGNAALNGWDGNHIEINNDGGFILSPQIGAGVKDNNNRYTGLFMGEVREPGENDSTIGLFGYNAGQRTLSLNAEDGSARFGATGQGQIVIDPGATSAKLYSDGYEVDYVRPSDMIPAQTKYTGGYSYWRKNGNNYTLLKCIEDYIEGYYYNGSFYEESNHTTLITPIVNQKYYDKSGKKCYKYNNSNTYEELTTYYKIGDSISSSDWVWAGGEGLEIDLNDPHIRFGSGKFRVDSDGQVYATGFATVEELEEGDYNIPGTNIYRAEYPTDKVEFVTDVLLYPSQTETKSIDCSYYYKDELTNDYTLTLIDNNGNVITHDTTHNTANDGISISITKSGNISTISFSVNSSTQITNIINNYLFRFTHTATGNKIDKYFGANLIVKGTAISVKGSYNSLSDLEAAVTAGTITPQLGDAYLINNNLYVYTNASGHFGTQDGDWGVISNFKGEDAKLCSIAVTSEFFKSVDGGSSYSPDNIVLTPLFQKCDYSSWAYSTDGGANYTTMGSTLPNGITMNSSTKALTISKNCELFNSNSVLVFKCTSNAEDDNNNDIYDTQTISQIKDGQDGINGIDGYSIWTTTVAPSAPDYTFTISNLVGPSGATPKVGEVIFQSNRYQYTISSVSTSTVKADTRQDLKGSNGTNGNNSATVDIYGRFSSTPSAPYSDAVSYIFSNGTLAQIPEGWSQNVPTYESNTDLYISSALAYGNTSSVFISANAWSTPKKLVADGQDGAPGVDGEPTTWVDCGNESQVIVCTASGAATANTSIVIPFGGYIGNSRSACTVTYSTLPTNMAFVSNTAATTSADGSLVFSIANGAIVAGDSGIIDLTFTCNNKTFVKKFSWAKSLTGIAGYNTTTINLYKRSSSSSTLGSPYSSAVTYTFSTQSLSAAPSNDWSQTIPEGTNPLYMTSAIAYSNTNSDSIGANEWSTPVRILQNGVDGYNTTTVNLYQRAATAPSKPYSAGSVTATYTFSTQTLSPEDENSGFETYGGGWSLQIPSGSNPLYISSAIASSRTDTASILSTKWSTPSIVAQDGLDGKSVVVDNTTLSYHNSSSGTTIPTGTWTSSPSPTEGSYLWTRSITNYKLEGTSTSAGSSTSYSVAYIGDNGNDGISIISVTPLYYLKTASGNTPIKPTSHVTSTSTSTDIWTTVVPTYDTNCTYFTCNEILYSDNTYQWSNVVADNGVNAAIVTANTASQEVITLGNEVHEMAEKIIPVSNTKTSENGILTLDYIDETTLEHVYAYEGTLHNLEIYGDMSLLFPQSQNNLYGYPLTPNDDLTCGNIAPSSVVPYGNTISYPGSSLYPKDSVLFIDDTKYHLDLDLLNYIDSNVHDKFIYEEGECKIIRQVGIDSQGQKYALDEDYTEQRLPIILSVEGDSSIQLNGYTNIILQSTYLLDNEYTNSFATNVDLVSKINMTPGEVSIEARKINMNGWISANENFWIDTEGNMGARNGTFSGNVYLPDGGKVIGGDGLLTNLQYSSVGIINGWGPLGFNTNDSGNVLYQDIVIDYFIPENFVPTQAFITLYTTRVMSAYQSGYSQVETTGVPKNLKLYQGNDNYTYSIFWASGTSYFFRQDLNVGNLINNAFGSDSYSPPISTVGQVDKKQTIELSNYLNTQFGSHSFIIRTSLSRPAAYSQSLAESTGAGRAVLDIIGYINMEG